MIDIKNITKKTENKSPANKGSSSKGTSWEPVAGWYDELLAGDDTYQAKVILPNLLRLANPAGRRVIDIACGQGFFSKIFAAGSGSSSGSSSGSGANGGAAEVLGVDISPQLIQTARTNRPENQSGNPKNLRFEVAAADKIAVATDASFDLALIILALQNIRELNETLKEAARVLAKNGELIIVLNHPCFRIPKGSAWGYDEAAKVQYRRVDKYGRPFTIDVDMTPGAVAGASADAKVFTKSFHRPLQDYFKALIGAGFGVVGLEEWISHKKSEPGPRAAAEDNARKEFPMFLTIVARKL